MHVTPGYKKTEVGVIPEEWEARSLPDVTWFQEGPGLRQWQFTKSGMKVINVTNLEGGVLNLERTERHIRMSEFNKTYQHFAVDAGDIVMASSGNSYSKTAIVRERDLPLVMNTSVIRFKPRKSVTVGFLWAFLNSSSFKRQIDLMITGGAQPNFGPFHLKKVFIATPPSETEQCAIAGALSDVDALLAGLDRLIAKKRDLKQAAMQQLLSGQTRLPGFAPVTRKFNQTEVGAIPEDWQTPTLGSLTVLMTNGFVGTATTHYASNENGVLYIQGYNVEENAFNFHGIKFVTEDFHRAHMKSCLRSGDLLTVQTGEVGLTTIVPESLAGSNCHALIISRFIQRRVVPAFISYYLNSNPGRSRLRLIETGTTMKHINVGDMLQFVIPLPPARAEQAAIAEVLSEMDAELAALRQRREKTRGLKEAMMQELLTGRTRLV